MLLHKLSKIVVRTVLLSVVMALPTAFAHAGEREKVGLVLSGGGAKGIAHVGIIKALEDNDIPIDYVAGTSMGAIVGSLYSCGWSPEGCLKCSRQKISATGAQAP